MKQRLVTRKNRKLRKLRERHPEVNVKLFYKRDIERLAQRYRLDLAHRTPIPASARSSSPPRSWGHGSTSSARRSLRTSQAGSCCSSRC